MYAFLNDQEHAADTSSSSTGGGVKIFGIGADFDDERARAFESGFSFTREGAREIGLRWRQKNCGSGRDATSSDLSEKAGLDAIDPVVVRAWESCMTQARYGLVCDATDADGLTTFNVEWKPSEIQRKHLPQVELRWNNLENLQTSAKTLPERLGAGSPVTVTFRAADPLKPTAIEVFAGDRDGLVTFGCADVKSPQQRKSVRRDARCGVETFKVGRSQACGEAQFLVGSGAVCGSVLKEARSAACGAEAFATGASPACGVTVDHTVVTKPLPLFFGLGQPVPPETLEKTCDDAQALRAAIAALINGSDPVGDYSYEGHSVQGGELQVHCRIETPNTCRHESFGVETYKQCRHESHGVERFESCRHESFGVESWPECRHESFGVELYKECEVID